MKSFFLNSSSLRQKKICVKNDFCKNWGISTEKKTLRKFLKSSSRLLKLVSLNSREMVHQYPLNYDEQLKSYCKIGMNSTSSFWNSRELEFHVLRILFSRVLVNSRIISDASTPSLTVYPYLTRQMIKKKCFFSNRL